MWSDRMQKALNEVRFMDHKRDYFMVSMLMPLNMTHKEAAERIYSAIFNDDHHAFEQVEVK